MGEEFVQRRRLTCERCGHRWFPEVKDVRICPKCKSAWWNQSRDKPRNL